MSRPPPRPRPNIERMVGYTPGEQPAPGERTIKLNTNENPYPPSPRVIEAIRAIDPERLRRYPPPASDEFRRAAAGALGVSPEMILAGNGSDEILGMVLRAYVGRGEILAYPDPTYSLYPVLAEIGEVKVVEVPWGPGWELPLDALLASRPRAIFFANPNAPSGSLVPPATVRALADRFEGAVLVDEAYVDFADGSCLPLLRECPNLIVTRTLSKGYSLAGLRFGYVLAAPETITQLGKVKDSYNCDALSIVAAVAAIEDQEHARGTWDRVRAERARLGDELARRGWQVIPSAANFLLATVPGGDGRAVYAAVKARGILVRHFDRPGLADKIRITVGTREQNDALLAALDQMRG
jgi:histidinol-phosphate aminotransferase